MKFWTNLDVKQLLKTRTILGRVKEKEEPPIKVSKGTHISVQGWNSSDISRLSLHKNVKILLRDNKWEGGGGGLLDMVKGNQLWRYRVWEG